MEWVELEQAPVSQHYCYDLPALATLDEDEFEQRASRVRQGLPPVG